MLDLVGHGVAITVFLSWAKLESAVHSMERADFSHLELSQEINLQIGPRRICRHPLSHGHPKPISQILRAYPDAVSCASGDVLLVFPLPSPRLPIVSTS
jgi:hypothetical protein